MKPQNHRIFTHRLGRSLFSGPKTPWITMALVLSLTISILGPTRFTPSAQAANASQNYSQGVAAYKRADFAKAATLLSESLKQDPSNKDAAFTLANALVKLKQYGQARQLFESIMQNSPTSDVYHQKSKKNLALLTQLEMTSNGNGTKAKEVANLNRSGASNYVSYAISNGKVMHWDPARMPLKVFISDGSKVKGFTPSHRAVIQFAMQQWQSATYGKVRFTETRDPNNADIVVNWKERLEHNRLGENPFESRGDVIIRSDLTIGLHHPINGQPMSTDQMKITATHEMGHAIGIQGHSPNEDDIMYFAVNPAQSGMTTRDKNTIRALYKMDADVTNVAGMSTAQTRNYMDKLATGYKAQQSNNTVGAIKQYKDALRLNPKDPKIHFMLALAYDQQGNTDLAIASYRDAITYDPNMVEPRYNISRLLVNQGVSQANSRQMSAARQSFQEAVGHLERISGSPSAPPATQSMLQTARKNLSSLG